ncbi:MAG: hypothetical protein JWN70_2818 [Planctomycetaceae bacterium]|nr:hypothetical protein [Planctomycetaceae bacterium]
MNIASFLPVPWKAFCRAVLALTLTLCVLLSTAMAQDASAKVARPSLWDPAGIQDFSLTDRTGETVTKQTLLGKEWVAGFIFTRCKGPCPTVVGQMKLLQEQTGVTLVTFSVQPEVDTPEVLKNFSTTYVPAAKPDAEGKVPHWYWLTGDRAQIYGLIGKSFRMPVAATNGPAGFDVIHSNNLVHVDEEGRVLGKYNAIEPSEMALLRRILQGKAPRGKMEASIPTAPEGEAVEVEGAAAAGLTITRPADEPEEEEVRTAPEWVLSLPALNASLNGLATILLLSGYVMIKKGQVKAHKALMLSNFAVSIIFLGSYLTYHFFVLSKKFPGTGLIRPIYFTILITHIILAATVPVLASITIYRALRGDWARHRSIARITFPIWVYVSITGVIIYFMLYQWPVAA